MTPCPSTSSRENYMSKKWILLVLPILLVGIIGCAGRVATPEGWSGGVVDEDTLYIGTRKAIFAHWTFKAAKFRRALV